MDHPAGIPVEFMNYFQWNAKQEKKLCQNMVTCIMYARKISFCRVSLWISKRQKYVFVILFPLMPLIMEMNQPLINADLTSNDFAIRHSSIIRPVMDISVCISQYQPHPLVRRHCAARFKANRIISPCGAYSVIQTLQFIILLKAASIPICNLSTRYLICSAFI